MFGFNPSFFCEVILYNFRDREREKKMSSQWLKNFTGSSLSDEEMQNIPNPNTELILHVSIKTMQAGGILGTLVVAPLRWMFAKECRSMATLRARMTRFGRNGVLIGAALGPGVTWMATRKEDDPYKIWDRCYRLRYNRNQVRVDQASFIVAAGGAAAGAFTTGGPMLGGVMGMIAGVLGAAFYNSKIAKKD